MPRTNDEWEPVSGDSFRLLIVNDWSARTNEIGVVWWMDPVLKEYVTTLGALIRVRKRQETGCPRWPEQTQEEVANEAVCGSLLPQPDFGPAFDVPELLGEDSC